MKKNCRTAMLMERMGTISIKIIIELLNFEYPISNVKVYSLRQGSDIRCSILTIFFSNKNPIRHHQLPCI
jgi:hypothetical protein